MHLLLSIPSENQHLLKCVFIKKSFVYKSVCVVFIFKEKKTNQTLMLRVPAHPLLLHREADAQEPTSCRIFYWQFFFFFF